MASFYLFFYTIYSFWDERDYFFCITTCCNFPFETSANEPSPVRAHGLFRKNVSMPISNTVVTRFNCFTLIILCNMSVHSGERE